MSKTSQLFNDFDTGAGSYNLFENAMRKAIDYDANVSDIFEAKVLTRPTLITRSPDSVSFEVNSDKSQTFAFMARILGTNSPHRFLSDPCKIEDTANDAESRRKAFNLIQMHTKVFMQTDSQTLLPEIGDIVKLKLERGSYGSFKTDRAEFATSVGKGDKDTEVNEECVKVASAFEQDDFQIRPLSTYGAYPRKMVYNGAEPKIQVENGRLPDKILFTVEEGLRELNVDQTPEELGIPKHDSSNRPIKFIKEAIVPFIKLAMRYYSDFKEPISISDSYRSYDRQVEMKTAAATAAYAAVPGTSNHGWGVAFDVNGTYSDTDEDDKSSFEERKKTKVYKWLSNNGQGFVNPENIREGWHWENVDVRKQIYELPIEGTDLVGNDATETAPQEVS
tara:strand:- start:306 stop:1481 length:1176 start_codon:yes stop_codon:yes gene_type:complete